MPSPCEQQPNIENIHKTLERMEQSHETERIERRESEHRLMTILEKLADQGARIDHLEEHSERTYTDVEEMYKRIRDVEMNDASSGPSRERITDALEKIEHTLDLVTKRLDKLFMFFKWTTHKYAIASYLVLIVMVAAGSLMDLMYHKPTFDVIVKMLGGK